VVAEMEMEMPRINELLTGDCKSFQVAALAYDF
jgi:hypothetical protein